MTNSISALTREQSLSDIKRDVSANEKRIDEAETRISATEDTLEWIDSTLAEAVKRIAQLEAKTEDLENRGRRKNIRLFGLKEDAEGARPPLNFVHDMLPVCLELDPSQSFVLERVHHTLAPAKPN